MSYAPTRRARRFLVALLVGSGLVLSGQAFHVSAEAAGVQWVDGGDDSPCLNDDNGAALTQLPQDQFCTPIGGCYQDDDGKWVLPSRKTGIWQGSASEVKYADEIKATPTPTPTKATPTKSSPTTGSSGTTGSGTTSSTTTGVPAVGSDTAEVAAPGAPTPPAAPTVTVKGHKITVTWTPSPNASLETVTGYNVQLTGADPVAVDAATTTHTFTGLEDGSYRAAVQAVNAAGPSVSSLPSEVVTVGDPVEDIVGDLAVEGDLVAGGSVTVTGTGFAKNVPELTLELHSTPVELGTVATDEKGSFTSALTIPATVEDGEHSLVVLYDGTEITSTPVTVGVVEKAAATAKTAATDTVPPHVGLAILAALALAGVGSLIWHLLTGRRRRTRQRSFAGSGTLATSAPGVS